ncbi:inositol monophosphatase family protein [Streptosporangium sp. NPDC000239]|uniref:inositol monophosphatase family protein n=1 Tax=Streptosporangium sp. NPDC000239 TaxID=3154248 RepID=UPI003333F2BC
MTLDVRTILPIAEQAVTIAADIVRTRLPGAVTAKGDRDMATEVDYAVEHAVRDFLTRETPEIAFLGEEEGGPAGEEGQVWALDPVDGTANLLHGIPLCGVSLGLIDNDTSILGVIDLPFLGSRYSAAHHRGAHLNGHPIHCGRTDDLTEAIVGIGDYAVGQAADARNRLRLAVTGELAARVQRVRMFGSAAVDLAWVAEGRIDAAIMLSNKPWDTAAGVLIAREAGAVVVDLDGTPHTVNAQATIATTPAILTDLLDLIAKADKSTFGEDHSRPALTNPPELPQ